MNTIFPVVAFVVLPVIVIMFTTRPTKRDTRLKRRG